MLFKAAFKSNNDILATLTFSAHDGDEAMMKLANDYREITEQYDSVDVVVINTDESIIARPYFNTSIH